MPALAVVPAVGVGGVEQRDAGIEPRVEYRKRVLVIAVALGRQTHAAERDRTPAFAHNPKPRVSFGEAGESSLMDHIDV